MEAKICPVCQKICPTNEFIAYGMHEDCCSGNQLNTRPGTIGTFRISSTVESKGDKKRKSNRNRPDRKRRSED